jgi:hypothetical protein
MRKWKHAGRNEKNVFNVLYMSPTRCQTRAVFGIECKLRLYIHLMHLDTLRRRNKTCAPSITKKRVAQHLRRRKLPTHVRTDKGVPEEELRDGRVAEKGPRRSATKMHFKMRMLEQWIANQYRRGARRAVHMTTTGKAPREKHSSERRGWDLICTKLNRLGIELKWNESKETRRNVEVRQLNH